MNITLLRSLFLNIPVFGDHPMDTGLVLILPIMEENTVLIPVLCITRMIQFCPMEEQHCSE